MPTTKIQLETASGGGSSFHDAERLVAQKRGLLWIDLANPTPAELERLQNTFEFHPLSIEDSSHFHQRSKVDQYEGYLFITLHSHHYHPVENTLDLEELHLFYLLL